MPPLSCGLRLRMRFLLLFVRLFVWFCRRSLLFALVATIYFICFCRCLQIFGISCYVCRVRVWAYKFIVCIRNRLTYRIEIILRDFHKLTENVYETKGKWLYCQLFIVLKSINMSQKSLHKLNELQGYSTYFRRNCPFTAQNNSI